ncbi:MAG TPA: cysteine--tRNA ligase [Nitrososphaerales archaeon]|nr:cysteine--tRNA ligase [Nitrososphaerales archaeon]
MVITFFNTMGRKLEEFKPINEGEVRMYTCGPTVWNFPHIGNYRTFLFEDMLRRFLECRGFKVTQVMNLTDVDDRIIKVCRENNYDIYDFTEKYAKSFFEDLRFLNIERADYYPRATQHVAEMVKIIEGLLAKKAAYRGEDGSIYFKISAFPEYGKLSGLKVEELKPGARVSQDDYTKESAQDFALWKAWDENDGKVFWETSLGRGRPGWHIECSAMSMKYLGEEFDIHTGGVDNIFPHHENEIAQSEAFTGKKFARYWLHSEHLLINEEKMSKRVGNIITIKDLKDKGVEGRTLRLALLSGHYRAQLNFTEKSLDQAASSIKRIDEFMFRLQSSLGSNPKEQESAADAEAAKLADTSSEKFVSAMNNDLDTPSALAVVFDFISSGNKLLDQGSLGRRGLSRLANFMLKDFDPIFGIVKVTAPPSESQLSAEDLLMLRQRDEARARKDWKLSDELRRKLSYHGIEVQDTPSGQKWRRK